MTATTAAAPTPSPPTNWMPISSMPSSEITTVVPANTTGPARGVERGDHRGLRIESLVEPLAVSRDDEQGVVDADAEPDHGGELGGELGHRRGVGEQPHHGEAGAEPNRAVKMGRPMASTEPKAISRMTMAAMRPMSFRAAEAALNREHVAAALDLQPVAVGVMDQLPQSRLRGRRRRCRSAGSSRWRSRSCRLH